MTLPTKTLAQLVSDQVTTWSSETGVAPVFSSGDMLLAVFQANATQLNFLQALVSIIVGLTRAASSNGPDLDSWMADFGFPRLAATYATGQETLSKNAPAYSPVVVLPGAVLQTSGGSVQYTIVTDTTQAAWSASAATSSSGQLVGGYVLQAGQTSMNVTIQANVAGSASNVIANALNQPATPIPGIDSYSNPTAISNGSPAETDPAYRARFVLFMQTLAKGTLSAIITAISSVQDNLTEVMLENELPTGAAQLGCFTAVVDDGSGAPPGSLLTEVAQAVENVRAFTVQPYIVPPTLIQLTIVLNVSVASGASQDAATAAAAAAILSFVTAIPTNTTCFISGIESAALTAANVVSVQPGLTTINGVQADFVPTSFQRVTTNASLITVGVYG